MSLASSSVTGHEASAPPVETELKLSLPASSTRQFWRLSGLSPLLTGKTSRLQLFTAYYDTPHFDLRRQGVALRLRRQRRRWVQTLKTTGTPGGALQQRIELEADAPEAVPDLEWVRQSGLVEFARTDDALPTLGIAFTTDFVRKATVVEPVPDTRIEICLDQGSIVAGQRREPICEVELELKQGELAPLFDLARQIVAVPGVRVESASKAQRGYRLAARERTATVRARTPRLPAGADIDTVFKTLAFECMAQLQGNEHGVLHSRDIEYLHQARVALRRLRSVFNVFSEVIPEKHFADQLEWLHDTSRLLGRARDWDVFVTGFLPLACKRLGD
ncbi:MAG: inorganic triphosphatase, partial [Burkholderiales bacterium]